MEQPMAKEKIVICDKQVFAPFSISNKLLAFLGPYPTAKSQLEKVKNFFPCYTVTMPSTIEEHSLNLSFMEILMHVFQFAPLTQNKEYISWLDEVQLKIKKQRENLDIFRWKHHPNNRNYKRICCRTL